MMSGMMMIKTTKECLHFGMISSVYSNSVYECFLLAGLRIEIKWKFEEWFEQKIVGM